MGELIDQDVEHLRLLKIGFYIMAALSGAFTAFALFYAAMGSFIVMQVLPTKGGPHPDPNVGWIFLAIGALFLLIGAGASFLAWFTGWSIGERRRWILCVVVSALCCLQIPFGTAIGVCGLIVLNRPSVKALFGQ